MQVWQYYRGSDHLKLALPKELIGIGIRVKGVLIRHETFEIDSMHSLSTRRLTGEINADFLPLVASRGEFIKDTDEYKEFCKIMEKKLRRVIRSLAKSALSYQDKKAEKVLSDVLLTVREALKKNKDILLFEGLPLFTKSKPTTDEEQSLQSGVIATALSSPSSSRQKTDIFSKAALKESLYQLKPKIRSRIKTLLRDDKRIVKKVKISGSEFLVSFAHLGAEEKESFVEGGIIFINRDHTLFKKVERKGELIMYHLIRLVTQEIVKLAETKSMEAAFDWHGKLIKDSFLACKE